MKKVINVFFRFINKDDVPKRCIYIKLLVEDKNEGKIEITLTNRELNNLIIYSYENKRVELDIGMHNFEIFLNLLHTYGIDMK